MGYLLDTHLLLWILYRPELLPRLAIELLASRSTTAYFSAVSFTEIAIKQVSGKLEFAVDLPCMRTELLAQAFLELQLSSMHSFAMAHLPPLHKDPFDRLLVAQARTEQMLLLTVDAKLAGYGREVLLLR